jgi:hypothetical protein
VSDKSDALLVASACAAGLAVLLFARAASVSTARDIAAHYDLTPWQEAWVADGVPLDLAISLDPACDVTVNVGREFPVVVSCPEVP